jgi:hypothetical protein
MRELLEQNGFNFTFEPLNRNNYKIQVTLDDFEVLKLSDVCLYELDKPLSELAKKYGL